MCGGALAPVLKGSFKFYEPLGITVFAKSEALFQHKQKEGFIRPGLVAIKNSQVLPSGVDEDHIS